jgi:hypothetical protein
MELNENLQNKFAFTLFIRRFKSNKILRGKCRIRVDRRNVGLVHLFLNIVPDP